MEELGKFLFFNEEIKYFYDFHDTPSHVIILKLSL